MNIASVTQLGLQERDGPARRYKYRSMAQILVDEQLAFASRMRAKNLALLGADLKSASVEERMGAALLRVLMNRMDVVLEDSEASIVRMVLPAAVMDELAIWGADSEDAECGRDIEQWDFMRA